MVLVKEGKYFDDFSMWVYEYMNVFKFQVKSARARRIRLSILRLLIGSSC